MRQRESCRSRISTTFVRPCERSIRASGRALSIGSRAGRPIMRRTFVRAVVHVHTFADTDGQGGIEVHQREDWDQEMAGWMAGSVSNYRLLITPPDPPIRRFTQEQSPTSAPYKVDLLTSARNDSINNASSAIALNTYPV